MTEVLITLMNAPRAIQRAVALGILAIVLAISGTVITGLISMLASKIAHIDELRSELYQLEQMIARKPLTSEPPTTAQPNLLFMEGGSISAIQANLQQRLTELAASSGATIASTSGTPQLQMSGATYVGLRAEFDGNLQAVHSVIRQLETSVPPLIIRKALIRGSNAYQENALNEPIHLSAQIAVYGAVPPDLSASREATKQ